MSPKKSPKRYAIKKKFMMYVLIATLALKTKNFWLFKEISIISKSGLL